jgi:hypothetical protein
MINTYGAFSGAAAVNAVVLPTDPKPNKLIVTIHGYVPYNFAYPESTTTWSSSNPSDTNPVLGVFQPAYDKFVSQGVPVVIGEFGTVDTNHNGTTNSLTARADYTEYYVTQAKAKGIKCVIFDNGIHSYNAASSQLEVFGLLNRSNNTWRLPAIITALMEGAESGGTPPGGGGEGIAAGWEYSSAYKDELGSTAGLTESNNEYTFSGSKNSGDGCYAGVVFGPNPAALAAMKTMTSFSFMVSGDGKSYEVMLQTTESGATNNHYRYTFTAPLAATKITVNVPANLAQADWGGEGVVTFVQNNIENLQFQPAGTGSFSLKVWDIRTYQ